MEMKKKHSSVDTVMNNIVSIIKAAVREKTDIVYTRDEGEFKVILPYTGKSAHHVPLKRLRNKLSEVSFSSTGSSGVRKRFDINVAGVNVLLSEAEFDYMGETDRAKYLASEKAGNRFAVFHGIFYSTDEENMGVSQSSL